MYNKFRQYQEKPKERQQPPSRTSRTKEFVKSMLVISTPLGCLWWFAELKYAGAAFSFVWQYLYMVCLHFHLSIFMVHL